MSTICQYRLPVKVFILNTSTWEWCGSAELLHGARYSESYTALPDFVKLRMRSARSAVVSKSRKTLTTGSAKCWRRGARRDLDVVVDQMEELLPDDPVRRRSQEMLSARGQPNARSPKKGWSSSDLDGEHMLG